MKPENAVTSTYSMDLSIAALEDAALLLPAAKFYMLTVSPVAVRYAAKMLIRQSENIIENPLSPVIGININSTFDRDEWTLESGDHIFWSPGA